MVESVSDRILNNVEQVGELYHRLMLVVAPVGGGKTQALQEVARRLKISLVNVNLELSRRMLELTERQRSLKLPRLLQDIVGDIEQDTALLDNIEILFDITLEQDPLRLLQKISRDKTVIAGWNGVVKNGYLIYAAPDHPEYQKYPLKDFLVIDI